MEDPASSDICNHRAILNDLRSHDGQVPAEMLEYRQALSRCDDHPHARLYRLPKRVACARRDDSLRSGRQKRAIKIDGEQAIHRGFPFSLRQARYFTVQYSRLSSGPQATGGTLLCSANLRPAAHVPLDTESVTGPCPQFWVVKNSP